MRVAIVSQPLLYMPNGFTAFTGAIFCTYNMYHSCMHAKFTTTMGEKEFNLTWMWHECMVEFVVAVKAHRAMTTKFINKIYTTNCKLHRISHLRTRWINFVFLQHTTTPHITEFLLFTLTYCRKVSALNEFFVHRFMCAVDQDNNVSLWCVLKYQVKISLKLHAWCQRNFYNNQYQMLSYMHIHCDPLV